MAFRFIVSFIRVAFFTQEREGPTLGYSKAAVVYIRHVYI